MLPVGVWCPALPFPHFFSRMIDIVNPATKVRETARIHSNPDAGVGHLSISLKPTRTINAWMVDQ